MSLLLKDSNYIIAFTILHLYPQYVACNPCVGYFYLLFTILMSHIFRVFIIINICIVFSSRTIYLLTGISSLTSLVSFCKALVKLKSIMW